jgi:hypothetical protein
MTLKDFIKNRLEEYKIHYFYYFTHIDNIEGIIENGILSRKVLEEKGNKFKDIANQSVINKGNSRSVLFSDNVERTLNKAVRLYLISKTPTFFKHKEKQGDIVFILVNSFILLEHDTFKYCFTDGNAASDKSSYFYNLNNLERLKWEILHSDPLRLSMNWDKETIRIRNAEFLIYPEVPINQIWKFYVNNENVKNEVEEKIKKAGLHLKVEINNTIFN